MAVSKILNMKDSGSSYHGQHLKHSIDYVLNPEKTEGNRLVGAVNCLPDRAFEQMRRTKRLFNKEDKRQGYHFIISFKEGEASPDIAFKITEKFVQEYIGDRFEAVYVVHTNTEHIHSHIVMNSVSFVDGKKYRYEKGDWAKYIQPITNRLCKEYGLSIIDLEEESRSKESSAHYKEWNEIRDGKFVWSDMIRRDIDACILQATDYDYFIELLKEKGYTIKEGKYLTIQPQGMKRFRRCDTLGDNYSRERIRERIAEEDLAYYRKMREEDKSQAHIVKCYVKRYRRAKLTGLQKRYYSKLYRIGKLKKQPYSQAWKYRDDIKKMYRIQKEYSFLVQHNVLNMEDLVAVIANLTNKRNEVFKEKSNVLKTQNTFKELFLIADRMGELETAEEAYTLGDDYFKDEHERYMELNEEIKSKGYTFEEVVKLKEFYKRKISDVQSLVAAVSREYYTAKDILSGIISDADAIGNESVRQQVIDKQKDIESKKR